MPRRQSPLHQKRTLPQKLPRIWLMTDARLDHCLHRAVQKLPQGSGVVLRHYHLDDTARHMLFKQLRHICNRRGHILIVAGAEQLARRWHAVGFHSRRSSPTLSRQMVHSAPVHNIREIQQAKRTGATIVFLSPLYATATHPGQRPLGIMQFGRLAALCHGMATIALGGMTARKGNMVKAHAHGWAAIEAFQRTSVTA